MRFINSEAFKWYVVLLFVGTALGLVLPANPAALHMLNISAGQYKAAIITLILPYALIWLSAFYAYHKLATYTNTLGRAREAEPFRNITRGAIVLAWGLALETILSLIFDAVENWQPSFNGARVLLGSYVALVVPLVAFTFIGNGTRSLTEIVRSRPSANGVKIFAVLMTVICTFFTYFVVHDQLTGSAPYKIPMLFVLLTIVIPYVYTWFIGLLAALELLVYSRKSKGVLYQRALIYVASGLAVAIVASIAVQYLNGVFSGKAGISLGSLIFTIYGLLVVEAIGYALIALGAIKLKKIEEI